MATRTLPMLCILFLLFSASLVFPCAEGTRILEETKSGILSQEDPRSYNPPITRPKPGEPYTRRCSGAYYCPPGAKP